MEQQPGEGDPVDRLQGEYQCRGAGLDHRQAGHEQAVRQAGAEDAQQGQPEPVESG